MALYRKYRPATFAEVVGQEHVTEPLSTALDAGRINHAYLFSGPRGCGKTSSARILARSLNCVQGPTSTPCGTCHSCVALGPGGAGNLDVIELDAASHGGVDDTRELRDRAFYAPAESRYRIFIVDEAHMVTTQGFNALLKIVEEPPEHLIFVFATTEPEKVLATIRSRTHHYPFRLLAPNAMRGLLEKICEQEQVAVADAVYPLVIRAGGGSPRDSLSVLDQLLAGAGDEGVTYARALALLGVTDVALIDEAVDALAAGDGAALFGTVDKVMDAGHDPRRFAVDLLERIRDLILMRAVPAAGERGLVDAPGDVLDRMREESERLGPATLARYADLLHAGLGEMRGATAPRLLLEVICARMLLPSASDAESAVLQRLERLEAGGGAVQASAPAQTRQADEAAPRFQRPSQRRQAEPDPAPTAPPARETASDEAAERVAAAAARAQAEARAQVAAAELEAAALAKAATEVAAAATAAADRARAAAAALSSSGPAPSAVGSAQPRSTGPTPPAVRPGSEETGTVPTVPVAAESVPTNAMPTNAMPTDAVPTDAVPSDTTTSGHAPAEPPPPLPVQPELVPSETPSSETPPPESLLPEPASAPEPEPAPAVATAAPDADDIAQPVVHSGDTHATADLADPEAAALQTPPAESEPERAESASTGGTADLATVAARWSEVRSKVRDQSRPVEAMLSGATVQAVENGTVVLAHAYAPVAKRLIESRNADIIRQAMREVFGGDWAVDLHVGAPDHDAPSRPAAPRAQPKAEGTPRFSRPSQSGSAPQEARPRLEPAAQSPVDDIPPPEEPDYPDDPGPPPDVDPPSPQSVTAEDEEEMMAEAAEPADPSVRRDPQEVAIELLSDMLGAKPLDG
ncbi:DNA polymerase III subunit gamma and tau [Rhodococcus sp. NPDC058505]|uniref:DNA polymerase III subunit gamma and tau n=1 Tax=Rhodococcus sp. NPDC058505 TaxID=3346531 RepID=UPI00364F4964